MKTPTLDKILYFKEYELPSVTRKANYGKARITLSAWLNQFNQQHDVLTLVSYDTKVAEYDVTYKKLRIFGWYSMTTCRHINDFLAYIGADFRIGKREIIEGTFTSKI